MSDLTNPNAARLRMCLGDETVEGSLGASSAGQGDVTTSALATPPPLDLTALREHAEDLLNTDPRFEGGGYGVYLNTDVLAALDRITELEGERDAAVASRDGMTTEYAGKHLHAGIELTDEDGYAFTDEMHLRENYQDYPNCTLVSRQITAWVPLGDDA